MIFNKKLFFFLFLLLSFYILLSIGSFNTKNIYHQKIKLVLHIGLKKTGSSALQGFFEENLDDLQKQGIFYPQSRHASVKYFFSHNIFKKIKEFNPKINYDDKTYFLQTGNAAYILDQYEKNPTLFDDIYKDALRNNCHTVILSSENMTTDPESLYRVLKKYPQFDIHVIMYIREVYSYFWTYYQQKLKHTHTYYIPYTEIILPIDIENWVDSSFKNEKILVTNYDVHKEHLVTNFFDKLSISIDMKKLKPANNINRSLNESEHNILELIQQQNKDSLAVYLSYVLTKNHSTKKSFRYYNQALAEKVYNQYRTVIQKANALLPADEKIPTQPHQPKGYTTRWNKKYIDIEDIKIILDSFDKNEKFEKSPYKIQCPPNFDLLAYYAKHFDIFIKNIDPYEHYAKSIKKAVLPK